MEKSKIKFDVAIIADGNASIGLGHIMRCSAIADALEDIGQKVCFIVSDVVSKEKISQLGYYSYCMNVDYRRLAEQSESVNQLIKEFQVNFVFIDSYYASNELFESVGEFCPVGCFGYGKNYFRGMQLIIPYGISSDFQWYKDSFNPKKVTVLFGPHYVPLRKPFWNISARNGSSAPQKLLLTCGGTDPYNISSALVKAIRKAGIDIEIGVVIGQFFHIEKVKSDCREFENVVFCENMNDLSEIMRTSDVAISAGGMTLYELMASSVPTIAYAFADNQLNNSLLDGAVRWCGDIRRNGALNHAVIDAIITELKVLLCDREKRTQLIANGKKICDGHGAVRIAKEIKEQIGRRIMCE